MRCRRSLHRLQALSPAQKQALQRAGLRTAADLLSKTDLELVEAVGLTLSEIKQLVAHVCNDVAPTPSTALELLHHGRDGCVQAIATGMPDLDAHLCGGIPIGALTELVGPAGVGKSQLCISLVAHALIAGIQLGAGVVYIDTEKSFQPRRLLQLLQAHLAPYGPAAPSVEALAERVQVVQLSQWDDYCQWVGSQLEVSLLRHPALLVVVDSIAAPVRKHFKRDQTVERQGSLNAHAAMLKYLARKHGAAVVVTNQVMSGGSTRAVEVETEADDGGGAWGGGGGSGGGGACGRASGSGLGSGLGGELGMGVGSCSGTGMKNTVGSTAIGAVNTVQGTTRVLSACLGNAWTHAVNVRLILQFDLAPRGTQSTQHTQNSCSCIIASHVSGVAMCGYVHRQLRVAKAPMCAEASFSYVVDELGVRHAEASTFC